MSKKIKTAIFPVGGFGTRFLPATKAMPKEMLPVFNKPIIQWAFEEAVEAGIENFIFITGRNKNAIENHFDHAYEVQRKLEEKQKHDILEKVSKWLPKAGHIAFVRQQAAKGLGHAVWCARNFIGNEPFVVSLADEMMFGKKNVLKQMIELYNNREGDSNVVGLYDVDKDKTHRYGIVAASEDDGTNLKVSDMIEKPKPEEAPSNTAIVGRYILQPEIFDYLDKGRIGAGGEIQLTDAMKELMSKQPFYGVRYAENRFDCGNPLGYLEANIGYALNSNEYSREEIVAVIKKFL